MLISTILAALIASSWAAPQYRWPEISPQVLVAGPSSWDPHQRYQVVVFLSAHCPCSASHESVLRELYSKYHMHVSFLGVHGNADENEEESRSHFVATSLPFEIIEDRQGAWVQQLGAMKTPHAYLIDTTSNQILYQGGVTGSHHGPTASEHPLQEAIDAALEGRPIPRPRARVLGCAIARRKKP